MTRSRLTDISGLGPKRIRDLLKHFQSVEAIQMASITEISKVPGLGESIAREIWGYFHSE